MSTIKSSAEHLTLNADGSSKDIKFQANGVEKASISSAGAFTSTTIDATKLTGALPAISGAALTNLSNVGKVLQVVQTNHATQILTTSTSYVATSLTASITPSSTSNKILVSFSVPQWASTANNYGVITVFRGTTSGTDLANNTFGLASILAQGSSIHITQNGTKLDSPNTTSSQLYTVAIRGTNTDAVYTFINGQEGKLTLMEIAG